jgi:hypothetical protein
MQEENFGVEFVENFRKSMVTMTVSIARKGMTQTLPKAVRDQVITYCAKAKKPMADVTMIVPLFGDYQKVYKDQVIRPRSAINTYWDNISTQLGERGKSGVPRGIPSASYIKVRAEFDPMVDFANRSLRAFMQDYDRYCEAGRRAADHNFKKVGVEGGVSSYMDYPTADEFVASMYIDISDPAPLPELGLGNTLHIPKAVAVEIANRNAKKLGESMKAAQANVFTDVIEQMDHVVKQLSQGKRLSASALINNSKLLGEKLRDFTACMDNDTRITNMADEIIANIGSMTREDWGGEDRTLPQEKARQTSIETAKTVRDELTKIKNRPAGTPPVAQPQGQPVLGGVLPDLL